MKRGVSKKLSRYSSVDLERLVRFEALYRKAVLSSADARKQYPELLKTYKQLLENASPAAQRVAYGHVQEVYQLARSAPKTVSPAIWIFVALVAVFSLTLFLQPSITGLFSSNVVPNEPSSNHAPLWSGSSDVLQVSENGALDLSGLFRDEDGDVLTYLVQPNEGMLASVDGSTAQIAFEPGVSRGSLTVIASDGLALAQHTVTVQKADVTPTVTPIPTITPEPVVSPTPVVTPPVTLPEITEPVLPEPAAEPIVQPTTPAIPAEVTMPVPVAPDVEQRPHGTPVSDGSIAFRNREGKELNTSAYYVPQTTEGFGLAADPNVVSVDVDIANSIVKNALVEDLQLSTAADGVLAIDDVPEEVVDGMQGAPSWAEVYAVNPVATFTEALLTVEAKANRLYKCKDWNFASQTCKGSWAFVQSLVPGSDYSIVISASDPGFAEINVTAASHLDADYAYISDIYPEVYLEDDIWSETIDDGQYVRAEFQKELDNGNVINIRARSAGGWIVVYEQDTDHEVGRTEPFDGIGRPDIILSDVAFASKTFDFKMFGAPFEFDYIHDNPGSTGFFMYTNATTGSSTFIGRPVYQNWTGSNMEGNQSSAEGAIPDLGTNITNIVSRCSRARPECYFVVQLYDNSTHLLIWRNQTRNWTNYTLTNFSGQEALNKTQDFDIECEDESGDCLVVYENSREGDDKFGYRTITGEGAGVVSSESLATVRTEIPPTKSLLLVNTSFNYLKLYPQYGTNYIGIGWQTSHTAPTIGGGMWDGSAFHNFTNFTALGSAAPIRSNRLFDCGWEGLSNELDCFWGSTQNGLNISDWNPNTSIWTSRGWASGEATHVINDVTACGTTTRTRGLKPRHDYVGYMTCDTANDMNGSIWNGSSNVKTVANLEDTASECGTTKNRGTQSLACALETSGNQFVFVWPDANALVPEFSTFGVVNGTWNMTSWALGDPTNGGVMFSGLDDVNYLELTPNPVTDEMMLIGTNIVRGANCTRWTGSTFSKTGCDTEHRLVSYGNTQGASFDWYRYESVSCPGNINQSITLDANTTGAHSCLNITGNNLTVNCNGNTIWFDGWADGNATGILAEDRVNVTIANCNIIDASQGGSGTTGIIFANISNGTIINSTILGNGTTNVTGIIIQNNSFNSVIINNTIKVFTNGMGRGVWIQNATYDINVTQNDIYVNGTSVGNSYALAIESLSANGSIIGNNLSVSSPTGIGIWLSQTNNTNFSSNRISNTSTWIQADDGNYANFSNTTFENAFGSVRFTPQLTFNGTRVVDNLRLNISTNFTRLNATNLTWLNSSAVIKFYGLSLGSVGIVMDGEDDDTYITCPANKCTKQSYAGGTLTFNVSSWTTFAGTDSSACGTITTNTVFSDDQTATGSCIVFGADNIYLDCAGYKITYDTSANGETAGVIANSHTNINITNCIIQDGTVPASSTRGINAPGINFTDVNSSTISQSQIITNGSVRGFGIAMFSGFNNTILNNSIFAQADGALPAYPSSGYGILLVTSEYDRIWNNTVETNGTNFSIGIYIDRSQNISIDRNKVIATGKYERNYGIFLNTSGSNNNITNNDVRTSNQLATAIGFATLNSGIRLDTGSNDSIIDNNTIFVNGTGGNQDGVLITAGSLRNSITRNFISTNGTAFATGIRFLTGTNETNVSFNSIWTNGSAALTAATDTSSYGINLNADCSRNIIVGNNITTDGNNSNYGMYVQSMYNLIDQNVIRTNGRGVGNLTRNAGIPVISAWNNITRNVIYTNGSGGSNHGVWLSTPAVNNSIINNSINTNGQNSPVAGGGFGGANNIGVYFNTVDDNSVQHNSISTNGTRSNFGVYVFSTNRSELGNNTIYTNGSDGFNFGVFSWGSNYTIIQNNTFWTAGTHDDDCVLLQQPQHNNTIDYNRGVCSHTGGGAATSAALTLILAKENNMTYNEFFVNATTGYGIYVTGDANRIYNNSINVSVANTPGFGIDFASGASLNNVSDNNFSVRGCDGVCTGASCQSRCIGVGFFAGVSPAADNNTVKNTIVRGLSQSPTGSYGIFADTAIDNNMSNTQILDVEGQGWIWQQAAGDNNSAANTTFANANGSVRIVQEMNLTGAMDIGSDDLNIAVNITRISATQRLFVNKSAFISINISSLIAAGSTNTAPARDEGSSGTFSTCAASSCTEISESGDQLFFNVSQFSVAFAAQDNPSVCTTIVANTVATTDSSSTGTCVTFGTDNITLDCQGHVLTFDSDGTGGEFGVFAQTLSNVTIKNCYIQDGNNLGAGNAAVNFTNVNNSFIMNNTMYVNGTSVSAGIVFNNVLRTNVTNNTIIGAAYGIKMAYVNDTNITRNLVLANTSNGGTTIDINVGERNRIISNEGKNWGISADVLALQNAPYTVIDRNNFTTHRKPGGGASPYSNNAIYVDANSGYTLISNNILRTNVTSDGNFGISLSGVFGVNVTNNTVYTFGSDGNPAIDIISGGNNSIINNSLYPNGTSTGNYGIQLRTVAISPSNVSQNNISYNYIQPYSADHGIYLSVSALNNTVFHNRIFTNGSGIVLDQGSGFNNITNNSILVQATGILIGVTADNNTFTDNRVKSLAGTAVSISNSNNSFFRNTVLNATDSWIAVGLDSFNNFTNTSFVNENGTLRFPDQISLNQSSVDGVKVSVSINRTRVNSTNLSAFNRSAFITFYGLSLVDPSPAVDYDDDGTYTTCPADVCTAGAYAGGTYTFNVSHWTSFAGFEGPIISCKTITASGSYVVGADILGTATPSCINISASDVVLDCQGYRITGSRTANSHGINSSVFNNITIKNCFIANFSDGIFLARNKNATVFNNTVFNNTDDGIELSRTNYSVVSHNNATDNGDNGIALTSAWTNNITNNTAQHSIGAGASSHGIQALSDAQENLFINNTLLDNLNDGISIYESSNNTLLDNWAIRNGDDGYAITNGSYNVINHSFAINSTGTGITLSFTNYSRVSFVNSSVSSTTTLLLFNTSNTNITNSSFGPAKRDVIRIASTSINTLFDNITLVSNGSNWVNITTENSLVTNFTNTLFLNESTNVRFGRNFSVEPGGVITWAKLNLSLNRVQLNASNMTWLNTSANITLDGVSFTDPQAIVDYEDLESYAECPADTCTEISYSGTTFKFNVSHWTSYSSRETPTIVYNYTNLSIVKFDAWDPVNITGLVNYSILLNFTNGSFYGVNVSDLYPANTQFNVSTPVAVGPLNDTFNLGDFSPGMVYMINITLNVLEMPNYTIMNNTVNVSWSNESLMRMNQSNMTNTTALVIPSTCGTLTNSKVLNVDVNATGNCFSIINSNLLLDCNGKTIFWDGEGAAINATHQTNITIQNCFILDNSTSGSNTVGINFTNITIGLIRNNTILTNDTSNGIGIVLQGIENGNIAHNAIVNNSVNANGSAGSHKGVRIDNAGQGDSDINITDNVILASGTADTNALSLTNATQLTIFRNYIVASGTTGVVSINGLRSSVLKYNLVNVSITGTGGPFGATINYSPGGEGPNISFNNISHSGGSGQVILLTAAQNLSNISDNVFRGAMSGISLFGVAANYTIDRNNFTITGSTAIFVQASTNFTAVNDFVRAGNALYSNSGTAGENATFQNVTIENSTGRINFFPTINITGVQSFTVNHYNVSQNLSTVRASVVPFMNVSAIITLNGLNFGNASAVFDPAETGMFSVCPPHICTNLSYDGSTFTFNVSHWSTFAASEWQDPRVSVCGVLRNNTQLQNDVNSSGTCFTILENNIDLDCNGFKILYDEAGIGEDGVLVKDQNNVTIRNCIIQDINVGGAFGVGINVTNSTDVMMKRNQIFTNGTTNNYGISLQSVLTGPTTILNNTIITQGSGTQNAGIALTTAMYTNITGNVIYTNGTTSNLGVAFSTAHNTTVTNNTIITNGTSTGNNAIGLSTTASSTNISNNTLYAGGTSSSGISAATTVNNLSVVGNYIWAASPSTSKGIVGTATTSFVLVANNTILSTNNGIDICSGCLQWVMDGNTINVSGAASINGITGTGTFQNYTVTNNNINVFGISTVNGISSASANVIWNITNNRIYVNGTTTVRGIGMSSAQNVTMINNSIIQNSTGGSANNGITFNTGINSKVIGNTIISYGSGTSSALNYAATNVTIDNNTIAMYLGNGTPAIRIFSTSQNYTLSNLTIIADSEWMNMTATNNVTFGNITFVTGNGSINFPGTTSTNDSFMLNRSFLEISQNKAFLNATNNSYFNKSANIVLDLTGMSFTDPGPGVDYEDDGTFTTCTADVCTETSFVANLFKFNVSHWTSFDALETSGITLTRPFNIVQANDTTTTDRIINFNWSNSTSSDGSPVSYQLVISNNVDFAAAHIIYNKTNIDPIPGNSTNQTINFSLDVDTTYWWRVVANSSTTYSDPSNISNFTVQSLLSIVLLNSSVNFSYASLGTQNDTDDNVPFPFRIENNGNLPVNISISSTRLFISGTTDYPTNKYRFKIRENESNSFNTSASNVTDYINFTPSALGINIKDLNWTNLSDDVYVDVNITVPMDEAAGLRNATVTFAVV